MIYVMFEYACREGNYALPNALRAGRARPRCGRTNDSRYFFDFDTAFRSIRLFFATSSTICGQRSL